MNDVNVKYIYDRTNATGFRKTEKGVEYKKEALLQIEVRQINTSKKIYISTGIKLSPKQFSTNEGFTCKNHPFALKITAKGRDIFNKVFSYATSDKCKKLSDVKNWNKQNTNTNSFLDFFKELKNTKALTLAYNTMKHHRSLLERLVKYGLFETFDDLTYENIMKFDTLLKEDNLGQTTVYKNHSVLRSYIQEAINRGYLEVSPYNRYQPKKGKGEERLFLSEAEIKQIEMIDYSTTVDDKLQKTKDLFLFQCFTGLSYADLTKFSKDDIMYIDGYETIRGRRQKTKEDYVIFLLPEAKKILESYNYKLPIISNQKYNDYLKLLAADTKINKHVSSHVGRHTFATYLLNKGVKIESVSVAMGHTNIKQTQVYARMLAQTSIQDIASVFDSKKTKDALLSQQSTPSK